MKKRGKRSKRSKRSSTKRSKKTKRSKRMRGGARMTQDIRTKLDNLFIFPEGASARAINKSLEAAVGQIGQDYLPREGIELYNEVVDYTTQKFMDFSTDGPGKIQIPLKYQ